MYGNMMYRFFKYVVKRRDEWSRVLLVYRESDVGCGGDRKKFIFGGVWVFWDIVMLSVVVY